MILLVFGSLSSFCQIDTCGYIYSKHDDFENKDYYYTANKLYGSTFPAQMMKVVSKKSSVYYLSLYSYGKTASVNEKGVIIILENGQKLNFATEKISENIRGGEFEYNAFITLTTNQLKILKTHSIKKWRLYVYDNELSENDMSLFKAWVNCLIEKK